MNRKNIWIAIKMMQRAKNLDMDLWQTPKSEMLAKSTKELHACGNSACFAGYLALNPTFRRDGGGICENGAPRFEENTDEDAVARWLEISLPTARALCYISCHTYPVKWSEVKPEHVIAKLKDILAGKDITRQEGTL